MIPVDQTAGEAGDCLMACVASILEIELEELPLIPDREWFPIFEKALRDRGYHVLVVELGTPPIAPRGYCIGIGPSPRTKPEEKTTDHACVLLDGDVVHDPHPTRTGLARLDYVILLIPIRRDAPRLREGNAIAEAVL